MVRGLYFAECPANSPLLNELRAVSIPHIGKRARVVDNPVKAGRQVRGLIANFALVIASLLVLFSFAELAARVFVTFSRPNIILLDAHLGWTQRANATRSYVEEGHLARVQTNELGLRSKPYSGKTTLTRIMVLGDSFTAGLEVSNDELFTSLLDELRPDLEVVNAGVAGYGTVQQLLLAKKLLPIVEPHQCLLMAFENDLVDNITPHHSGIGPRPYVNAQGEIMELDWDFFDPFLLPIPAARWLHRHSVAAYLFRNRVWITLAAGRLQEMTHETHAAFSDEMRWRLLTDLVRSLNAHCPVTIAAIPNKEHVSSDNGAFSERMKKIAAEEDFRFVELQSVLGTDDYYTLDIHWNKSGHSVVAEQLARRLPR